jgi:beta-galactosidase
MNAGARGRRKFCRKIRNERFSKWLVMVQSPRDPFPPTMRIARIGLFIFLMAGTGAVFSQSPGPKAAASPTPSDQRARRVIPFDANWRFLKSDAKGAEAPEFDDSQWRVVNVPHDWSIEGPFSEDAPATGAGGFLPTGVGWYRKHFVLPDYGKAARLFIEFDGVLANSDVWINGFHLGKRPYGFVSFAYELTGHVNIGAQGNVLAVRADDGPQPASRFYVGAGIYRHVRLVVMAPLHIDQWGVAVSTPVINAGMATVGIRTTLVNQVGFTAKVLVESTILDPSGRAVQRMQSVQTVPSGDPTTVQQQVAVPNPQLWDLATPRLYRAVVRVYSGNTVIDDDVVPFGIREFHFDPGTGFWLNGRNFKIKGVCLHCEGGAVGAAVPLATWQRRLEALRALGVNAIRTAHNPPAPEFLDLCDRMGFLVMEEMFDCWTVGKNDYDYHLYFKDWSKIDATDTVRRDRNHPSIILYSAGNEIHDTPNEALAKGILSGLVQVFHANDPTRPVTQALFRPNRSHDYTNGLADMLDVVGQNYREREILAAHDQKPSRSIIGTENGHDKNVWLALRDHPAYSGQFLWTGVDYLGEARRWPRIGSSSGLLDRTGTPRPMAYQRESWWSDVPMARIVRRVAPDYETVIDPGYDEPIPTPGDKHAQNTFADWSPETPKKGGEDVEVYSNCQEVELFLNGRSLGTQSLPQDASPRKWTVPFQAGVIRAVAKNGGSIAATDELKTAGAPAKITLSADRTKLSPSFDDVAYVQATITDANGVEIPNAHDLVSFNISGPGAIAAVDNGDNSSTEPFQATQRHAYEGQCFAIVRATAAGGAITLTASAPGLGNSSISIPTTQVQPGGSL